MDSLSLLSILVFAIILRFGDTVQGWDSIVFSQSWPMTTCIGWKGTSQSHFCVLPQDKSHWNVHGVWPTQSGTEGPNFCKHVDLNITALSPIIDKLEENWTNVEMPTEHYSFWKHEWQKHGSCATSSPEMDSELKYFSQGLSLNNKYSIANMLARGYIIPGDKPYSYSDIYDAVRHELNHAPEIHCIHDRGTGKILLSEIHICFNAEFEIIDCRETKDYCGSHDATAERINYPSSVPETAYSSPPPSQHWLYKVLYILRLLMWFSP